MAEAIIAGLLEKRVLPAPQIIVADMNQTRALNLQSGYGISIADTNEALCKEADIVILSVKPQVLHAILPTLKGSLSPDKLVLSIVAGVSTKTIESQLRDSPRVVRTMPNTPAKVQLAATAICGGAFALPEDMQMAAAIFNAIGITEELEEHLLDAVTGLSGSGPAYVFVMLEAMADAGVKMGLPRKTALRFAAQTVLGSASLLQSSNTHPGILKDMVTSPGGTTIAGLHALEESGFRAAIIGAVETATLRSKELGKLV